MAHGPTGDHALELVAEFAEEHLRDDLQYSPSSLAADRRAPKGEGGLRGTPGVLKGYARGTQGVLKGYARGTQGVLKGYSRGAQGALKGDARSTARRSTAASAAYLGAQHW